MNKVNRSMARAVAIAARQASSRGHRLVVVRRSLATVTFGALIASLLPSAHGTVVTYSSVDLNIAGVVTKDGLTMTPTASNGGSIGPTFPEFPFNGMWIGRDASATNGSYSFSFDRPITSFQLTFNALTYNTSFNPPSNETLYGFATTAGGTTVPAAINLLSPSFTTYSNGVIRTTSLNGAGVISFQSQVPFDSFVLGHTKTSQFNGDGVLFSRLAVDYVPSIYGVFVGTNTPGTSPLDLTGVRGDIDARKIRDVMSTLPGFRYKDSVVLVEQEAGAGIPVESISAAIAKINLKMKPGDKFVFFAGGHGGSEASGIETTITAGNEFFDNSGKDGKLTFLTDKNLTEMLAPLGDHEKWVFLDSCGAGGFWGNSNPHDSDLDSLRNIALFAASAEDSFAFASILTGEGFFSSAIEEAFSYSDLLGRRNADANADGVVDSAELRAYLAIWSGRGAPVAYEKASGDVVPFTPGMYKPVAFNSADFGGTFNGSPTAVPEPTTLLLTAMGVIVVGVRCKRLLAKSPPDR